jgi:hypothetical protein
MQSVNVYHISEHESDEFGLEVGKDFKHRHKGKDHKRKKELKTLRFKKTHKN